MNYFSAKISFPGWKGNQVIVESLIRSKDVPVFPFNIKGEKHQILQMRNYRESVRKRNSELFSGRCFPDSIEQAIHSAIYR